MYLLTLFRSLAVCCILSAPAFANPATRVVDGDTIIHRGITYRLEGIDAPELAQRCGQGSKMWDCGKAAKLFLEELVSAGPLGCTKIDEDGYGRTIAICRAGGVDLGAAMVAKGQAWAFRKYSQRYVDSEKAAVLTGAGIWSGPSEPAWDFRAKKWNAAEQNAPQGCPIKGNISQNGRIYHTPWSDYYSRTRINEARGERWFCSETEALAAGWRAPR